MTKKPMRQWDKEWSPSDLQSREGFSPERTIFQRLRAAPVCDGKKLNRMSSLKEVCRGLPLDPLPPNRGRDPNVPHAPTRSPNLTAEEERVSKHTNSVLLIVSIAFITEQCSFNEITFYDTYVYKCSTLFKAHISPHNGHLDLLDTGVTDNINNGCIQFVHILLVHLNGKEPLLMSFCRQFGKALNMEQIGCSRNFNVSTKRKVLGGYSSVMSDNFTINA